MTSYTGIFLKLICRNYK